MGFYGNGRFGIGAALTAFGVSMLFSACGTQGAKTEVEPFAVDSLTKVDSLRVGESVATCSLTVDYPVSGNEALVKNVRGWIAKGMAAPAMIMSDSIPSKVYDGIADGKVFLDSVVGALMSSSKADFDDYAKQGFAAIYEYVFSAKESYQTPSFVTYVASNYIYQGGAHGSSTTSGAVFSLDSGDMYGWNMFVPDSLPAVKSIVKESLMKDYFKVGDAAELRAALLVDPDTLPLPSASPYFMPDGVHFVYQQYEIAPYAAGMPECTVPYSSVMNMFTPAVEKLVAAER